MVGRGYAEALIDAGFASRKLITPGDPSGHDLLWRTFVGLVSLWLNPCSFNAENTETRRAAERKGEHRPLACRVWRLARHR